MIFCKAKFRIASKGRKFSKMRAMREMPATTLLCLTKNTYLTKAGGRRIYATAG
jgi:hypothetical protein